MATDHNIRQLIINKVPTKAQYDQMVKNADELYLTPDDSNGLPDQTGQSGKYLTTNGTTASWASVPAGTVTSVRVQATSPVQSSTSTAQSSTLNTTISLADGYGDTKNPYASKTKNYVLAAPVSANGTPSFRALDKADIPLSDIIDDSTITKNSSDQIQTIGIKDSRTDNTVKTWTGTKAQYDALVPTDWTVATYNSNLSSDYSWNAVSFDGTKFLALASDGYVSTSTDGVTWSAATRISALAGSDSYWSNLCYDGTKFLAISGYHDYYMSTSTDGLTWSTATKISNLFHREGAFALCYGNGKYVLMDEYGRISTSTNGTTWSNFVDDEYPLDHCAKIIYADNKFMALASNGYVLTSTNGTTWTSTQCTNLNGYYWYNIGYDGSKYIAVSNNGYVSTSIDGLDWTAPIQNTNLSGNNLWWGSGMAYNGTRFVITTSNGYISTKDKGGEGLDSDTLYNIKNYGLYLGLTEIANVSSGDSLPDQTGNSGKFLTTNGTTVSWDNVLTTQTAYTSKGSATKVPQITTNTLGQVTGITEVDITHQSIKTLKTDNTTAQSTSSSEAVAGSGTINLHKVSKTGSYNDLLNKPTIPQGTVTSVQVQAGTGLSSSTSTAQNTTLSTTISVASGYKLPTTTEWSGKQDALPTQSGNSGKFLTTNGSTLSWGTVDALPDQTGNSGKFLTTNGSTMSWATVQGGSDIDNSTITKNTNDELQTVGIKDARTDNTIKTWTGTKQQYDNLVSSNWSTPTTGENFSSMSNWYSLAYGAGKFVILSGSGYISTSTDGTTWTSAIQVSNLGNRSWTSLAYGDGKFVANIGKYISTSTDGINWTSATQVSNLGNRTRYALTYGDGKFVAISESGGYVSTSTDGINWTQDEANSNLSSYDWYSLIYGNNKFIALGPSGYISISTDGINWDEPIFIDNLAGGYWYNTLAYDGSKFIILSQDGYMSTSIDGIAWEIPVSANALVPTIHNYIWWNLIYADGKLVALSSNYGYISTKNDGIDSYTLYNVVNNGLYLGTDQISKLINTDDSTITKNSNDEIQAVGVKDVRTDNTIQTWTGTKAQYNNLVSSDWSIATYSILTNYDNWMHALAYGNGKFVAVSETGYVSTSTDGITWSTPVQSIEFDLNMWGFLAYGNGKFVAMDIYGSTSISTDGINWTPSTYNPELGYFSWVSLTYGNGKFVAIDSNGGVTISTDGITWSAPVPQTIGATDTNWFNLAYGNGKFVAIDGNSYISTSEDGITWTTPTQNSNLSSIGSGAWNGALTYGNGKFMLVSLGGDVSTSTDGITWTVPVNNSNLGINYWCALTYGNGKFVAMSERGEYISTKNDGIDSYTLYNIINDGLYLGTIPIADIGEDPLPSQSGNSGKYLTTNGTTVSWATVQAGPKFLTFQNITASTWVSDNTYSEYSYKCVLTCTGVTSSDYAQVIFNPAQSVSGNYANVCLTDTDTVTIYSKVNTAISIPTITVIGSN